MGDIMLERSSNVKHFLCAREKLFLYPREGKPFDRYKDKKYPLNPRIFRRGYPVTICIGSLCEGGAAIVSVSDMKLSTGHFSSDYLTHKVHPVGHNWWAMFAGTVPDCNSVFREATARLKPKGRGDSDYKTVSDTFRESYQFQLRLRREDQVLSQYDMGLEEFKKEGLRYFGERIFSEITGRLEAVPFSAQFLVFGFSNGRGHIFSVDYPGYIQDHTKPGFCAIGSGEYEALSMMYFQGLKIHDPVSRALYKVCIAKFMAEIASDVGKSAVAIIAYPDKNRALAVERDLLMEIKRAWRKQMQRMPSKEIIERIDEGITASRTEDD